jgi:hypothetical protein
VARAFDVSLAASGADRGNLDKELLFTCSDPPDAPQPLAVCRVLVDSCASLLTPGSIQPFLHERLALDARRDIILTFRTCAATIVGDGNGPVMGSAL